MAAKFASLAERDEHFRSIVAPFPNAPADADDVRFEITPNPEPDSPSDLFTVRMIDDRGEVVEHFTTDDPYGAVEAFREAQTTTLEERFETYAERGW